MSRDSLWSRRFSPKATDVPCPQGDGGRLVVERSCLQTHCVCDRCGARFSLAELAPTLDEAAFARLAELVGDHLSDRV